MLFHAFDELANYTIISFVDCSQVIRTLQISVAMTYRQSLSEDFLMELYCQFYDVEPRCFILQSIVILFCTEGFEPLITEV